MSTTDPVRPNLSMRTPQDVLAIVPYLVGFEPSHSLVVIGLAGKTVRFTARQDLPTDLGELPAYRDTIDDLTTITARNANSCLLIGYGPARIVTPVMDSARQAIAAAGPLIQEAIRVTDNRFYSYMCQDPTCCPPQGLPTPGPGARIQAEAVLAGMTTTTSRADLVASIAPHTGQRRHRMDHAARQAIQQLIDELDAVANGKPSPETHALVHRRGIAAVDRAIEQHRGGQPLSDHDAATLITLLHDADVRDHAMLHTGPADVDLWSDLTRRAPHDLVTPAATLLAYTAWLTGNGALANVALDRTDPEYTMAHLLRQAMNMGIHPSLFAAQLNQMAVIDQHDVGAGQSDPS